MELAWLGLMAFMAVAFVRGLRFRRGTDHTYLGLYRDTSLPAVYRHIPLVLPYASGYVLALLGLGAVRGIFGPNETDRVLDLVLTTLGAVAFLWMCALSIVRMYAPPPWLTPDWLAKDDQIAGYERPKPGWTDRAWLLTGVGAAVIAGAFVIYVSDVILRYGVR
jgi:hypothetical protein